MIELRIRLISLWLGIRRLFRWKARPQLARLLELHAGGAENPPIVVVAAEERKHATDYERCQVCSLCTFSCVAVREGTAPPAFEPKQLILGPGRAPGDGAYTWELWVPCATCGKCTVECPNEVPVHRIAEEIARRRG